MGDSKPHLRALTFAGVLILVGGLLIGLFQGAGAVSIQATSAPGTASAGTTQAVFEFTVTVPEDQLLPVDSVRTVVEETNSGPPKTAPVTRVGDATCNNPIPSGCTLSGGTLSVAGTPASIVNNAVTSIQFSGTNPTVPSSGEQNCPPGGCNVVDDGYGYSNTGGYGYLDPTGSQGYLTENTGYGYANGDLDLTFEVTINPNALGVGHHWVTFIVNTGSGVISDIQSQSTYVQITGGGGGGGGGGTTPGAGDGRVDVNVGGSFDGEAGQVIRVTGGLPSGVLDLQITLAQDCDNCRMEVTRSMTRPGGTPNTQDTGFTPIYYLTISVVDSNGNEIPGAVAGGFVNFGVTQAELPANSNARQVLLMRHQNPWIPLETALTTDADAEPLEYNATLPGFSFFAVVVDAQAPTFSSEAPTGNIQQVTPTIEADFTDNRAIDVDSFELTIDGEVHDATTGSLTTTATGFTYVPSTALSTSEHTVEASISDTSGHTTTETWTFTVSTPECPSPPRILSTQPTDGGMIGVGGTISVTIEAGTCDVHTSTLTLNGETVPGFTVDIPAGETETVTALLPATIGGGETVDAVVTIADTDENTAQRSWSFNTQQDDGPDPGDDDGPEDDGGIPGWVWIIILLLIAAAAIGGYVYYQQQEEER